MPIPLSLTLTRTRSARRFVATTTGSRLVRILDRVVDEVDEHLLHPVAVGVRSACRSGAQRERHGRGHPRAHGLDRLRCEHVDVDAPSLEREISLIEARGKQQLVREIAQSSRLRRDHLEQLPGHLGREPDVLAKQRPRGSEDAGQRCAQLVGDGRDELALALVHAVLEGEVAERIDDPLRAEHGHDRQPELVAVDVDGHGDRPRACSFDRDCDLRGDRGPPGEDFGDRRAENALAVEARNPLRGTVPEPDDAGVVEQEDPVADRLEHLRRVLALGCDGARGGLGFRKLLALHLRANARRGFRLRRLVQPRVPHRGAELADEPLDEVRSSRV